MPFPVLVLLTAVEQTLPPTLPVVRQLLPVKVLLRLPRHRRNLPVVVPPALPAPHLPAEGLRRVVQSPALQHKSFSINTKLKNLPLVLEEGFLI